MRIAFLCKRYYTAKDVILDRYGRLFELPQQLAHLGHEVHAWSLDYRSGKDGKWGYPVASGKLNWTSYGVGRFAGTRLLAYPHRLFRQVAGFQPDLILGASDIPHVALATWLGKVLHVPVALDLYDNFESFGQARIPGFRALLSESIRRASLVITVGNMLKNKVQSEYQPVNPVWLMPNGVDTTMFRPGSRESARTALGLPLKARLIGTAGGLSKMKGIEDLYAAWEQLAASHHDLHLILAGPIGSDLPFPAGPRVHHLGILPHTQVAELFRALDVGIISIADTAFGRYCFPQKAYEMMACELPIAVSDVGEMSALFASNPCNLFKPGEPDSLAAVIRFQMEKSTLPVLEIQDWPNLVRAIEPELKRIAGK